MRRALLLLLLALVVWATPVVAFAQIDDKAVAQAKFTAGRAAYDAGRYAEAYALFKESQRLDPATGTELSLALSADRIGRLVESKRLVDGVIAKLEPGDPRMPVATELRDSLAVRIPRVRLDFEMPARVFVDRAEVTSARAGSEVLMDPGTHVVVLSAVGYADGRHEITVAERERTTLRLDRGEELREPRPSPQYAPDPPPQPERPMSSWRKAGWSLVGVGVVGLVATAVLAGFVSARGDDVEAHCDELRRCDDEGLDAAEEGKRLSIGATVTFAVSAAAGATGVLLLILDGTGVVGRKSSGVGVAAMPGGAGLSVRFD